MIKLKNGKEYQNFKGMSGNKITRQWNNIKTKVDKKKVTLEELEYIIKTTTNKQVLEEVIKLYNPKVKQYNKLNEEKKHWYNKHERTKKGIRLLSESNRQSIKESKAENLKTKIRGYIDQLGGIGKYMKGFYTEVGGNIIPNPEYVGIPWQTIEKQLRQRGEVYGMTEAEIAEGLIKKKEEHDIYLEEVHKINQERVEAIDKATTEELNRFLYPHRDFNTKSGFHYGYFGYILGADIEKAKLESLIGKLNPAEKLAIINLMVSDEFNKQWDSDQESDTYDQYFREARMDEIISILENHIGEGTQYDPEEDVIKFYPLKKKTAITTAITLSDYL